VNINSRPRMRDSRRATDRKAEEPYQHTRVFSLASRRFGPNTTAPEMIAAPYSFPVPGRLTGKEQGGFYFLARFRAFLRLFREIY
jgi:hypothetical protein